MDISSFKVTKRDDEDVDEVIVGPGAETQVETETPAGKETETPEDETETPENEDDKESEEEKTEEPEPEAEKKPEDEKEPEEKEAEKPENKPTETIEDIVAKKTEGKFKTVDDLVAALVEAQKPKEAQAPVFKDDFIKKVVDYYDATGNITDVVKILSTDYSKIGDEAMMKMDLREQYPTLSEKAINAIYQEEVIDKYKLDEEENEPEAVEIGRERLAAAAQKLRDAKIKQQADFKIPESKQKETAPTQPTAAEIKAAVDADVQRMSALPEVKAVLDSKRVAIRHKDGDFNFEVENPGAIVEMMADPSKFWQLFVKDGKIDYDKWFEVASLAIDGDGFKKGFANNLKSLGKQEILDEIKNKKDPAKEPGKDAPKKDSGGRLGILEALASRGVHRNSGDNRN